MFVHPQFLFSIFSFAFGVVIFAFVAIIIEISPNETKIDTLWGKFKSGVGKLIIFVLFLLVIANPFWVVTSKIDDIRKSLSPIYEITLNKNDSLIGCAVSIGSTTSSFFYWDVIKKESLIVPKKQVIKVRVLLPKPPENEERQPPPPGQLSNYAKKVIEWNKKIDGLCRKYS